MKDLKDLRSIHKLLIIFACALLASGLGWVLWHDVERSPLTFLLFGTGLALLASVARNSKTQLSEKDETLQISKV